jgi:hypothetical protein
LAITVNDLAEWKRLSDSVASFSYQLQFIKYEYGVHRCPNIVIEPDGIEYKLGVTWTCSTNYLGGGAVEFAHFAVGAKVALPALLTEVERLRAELEELRAVNLQLSLKGKRVDVMVDEPPYQKEPEELLPNGTLVYVNTDETQVPKVILWSDPSDQYPHRYNVADTFGLCTTGDFMVVRRPTEEEQEYYDGLNREQASRWKEMKDMLRHSDM